MSIIDQRPTASRMRYSAVRPFGLQSERKCTERSRYVSPQSLSIGTVMLAKKTNTAMGNIPAVLRLGLQHPRVAPLAVPATGLAIAGMGLFWMLERAAWPA